MNDTEGFVFYEVAPVTVLLSYCPSDWLKLVCPIICQVLFKVPENSFHQARQVILEEKTNRYIKMDQLMCVCGNMNDCWEALCCSVEFNITPGSGLLDLIPSRHQSLWNWSTANELMSVMSSWIIKWSVSLMIGLTSLWGFQQLLYQQKTKTQRCVRLFIARHNPSSSH